MGWFGRHKILSGIFALVVLLIVVGALAGGGDDGESDSGTTLAETETTEGVGARLFEGRPDAQREDQERELGQATTINGVEGTVESGGFRQSLSEFFTDGYLVIDVTLRNGADGTRAYNVLHWRIQTPDGQVRDAGIGFQEGALESGDLVAAGSVSGSVSWEIGDAKGDFYVIWKPEAFDAARGIWKVTV